MNKVLKEVVALLNSEDGKVNKSEQLDLTALISPDFKYETTQDSYVISEGLDKPYFINEAGLTGNGVYVKRNDATVSSNDEEIEQMIISSDGKGYENRRSVNQNLTFKASKNVYIDRKADFANCEKLLKNTNGLYNGLALLLSDQNPFNVVVNRFENEEVVLEKKYSGSLLKQFYQVIAYLNSSNLENNDVLDYPEEAILETLLNSFIHADYSLKADLIINMSDSEIEFVVAGGLLNGVNSSDLVNGISVLRNKKLANVFKQLGFAKLAGKGIGTTFKSYDGYSLPVISTTENSYKITLFNCNGDLRNNNLKVEEEIVVNAIKEKGYIYRKNAQEILETSQTTSGRVLKRMVDKGILKTEGKGKSTKYLIA